MIKTRHKNLLFGNDAKLLGLLQLNNALVHTGVNEKILNKNQGKQKAVRNNCGNRKEQICHSLQTG